MKKSLTIKDLRPSGHWPRESGQEVESEPMTAPESISITSLYRQQRISQKNAAITQFCRNS